MLVENHRVPAMLRPIVLAAALLFTLPAAAQAPVWPGATMLHSQLYFGLRSADGAGVSEQQWQTFLAEVVTPRFPNGLTVLNAYGQGGGTPPGVGETTKVLIVVHPHDQAAQNALAEIKAEYRRRFRQIGVFHTDWPARIAP